jgi:putative transcriptional regulator
MEGEQTMATKTKTKAKRGRVADRIMAGLEEALLIAKGEADPATYRIHVPEIVDVKAIRMKQKLSQEKFAMRYGFTVWAVREWEQGRRQPERAARVLLKVIEREPAAVKRALDAA